MKEKLIWMLPLIFGFALSGSAWAEACLIRHAKTLELLVCYQNQSTPSGLFQKGGCNTQSKQQTSEAQAHCPKGHWGTCRTAKAGNGLYRQDIFYYSNLKRHTAASQCRRQGGVWMQF